MKRPPIQEILSSDRRISYGMIGWRLCLLCMIFGGGMIALLQGWGTELLRAVDKTYTILGALISSTGGILCMLLAQQLEKRYRVMGLLRLVPWVVLVFLTTPASIGRGMSAWINGMLSGWNRIHAAGIPLLSYSASTDDIRAFTFSMALLMAQLLWWAVWKYHMIAVNGFCLFWVLVPLAGGSFQALSCGVLLAGMLGLAMTGRRKGLWKIRMVWTVVITLSLTACAVFVPGGDWQAVRDLRENVTERIRIFRYGEETLPEGDLYLAGTLQQKQGEMLQVHSEQSKALYLKNYSGGNYENGCFLPLSDAEYGGEYAGMLRWLSGQNFDPFTQVAQYYTLGSQEEFPEENVLTIRVTGAGRARLYIPASLEMITDGRSCEKNDLWIESSGIRGAREYSLQEISGSRPSELAVPAEWISAPQTETQLTYCEAEEVYRDFVYDNYAKVDSRMYDLMQKWFWEDYTSDGDGIYSAVTQIRNRLRDRTFYTMTPEQAPEGEDPIEYFLTQSREGNAMLYAATAVEAFRAHGIPARYAEGYYISEQSLADSEDGTISVLGEDAHAWAEVYFDGIGWLPVDVAPGYYYDAVKLQQMVATPDMVHKTLAQDDNLMDAEQITDSGNNVDTPQAEIAETIRNLGAFRLGLAALALLLFVLVTVVSEILRILFLWRENSTYDRKTSEEHAEDMERKLIYFLKLRGIEARLGWNTDEVETAIMEKIPEIRAGEYRRICDLLQKTIYGNIAMEPYEERTVNYFLRKLYRPEPGSSFIFRWRLRYGVVGYEMERLREKRRRKIVRRKHVKINS